MSPAQSILVTAGPQAASIEVLWWVMFWTTAAVFVAVLVALGAAVVRGRSTNHTETSPRTLTGNVAIAGVISAGVLVVLLAASVLTGRTLAAQPDPSALQIQLTGHQWWWQVDYWPGDPAHHVADANEIHVPIGRDIVLSLTSDDVIHSFWVPAMQGKMDLIPGRTNTLSFRADRAGKWLGQCAEYCGMQHAHMRLVLIAHEPAEFDRWFAAVSQPAAASDASALETRGRSIVVQGPCAMCHALLGTPAGARTAPDLTHVASRSSIAAGTLPNTGNALDQWIADPQAIKIGTRMPKVPLNDADRQAVVAFLRQLR